MENEANVGLCLSELHEKHSVCGETCRSESEASVCPFRLFSFCLESKGGLFPLEVMRQQEAASSHASTSQRRAFYLNDHATHLKQPFAQAYLLVQTSPSVRVSVEPSSSCIVFARSAESLAFFSPCVSGRLVRSSLSSRSRTMIIAGCHLHSPSTQQ